MLARGFVPHMVVNKKRLKKKKRKKEKEGKKTNATTKIFYEFIFY